MQPFSIIFVKRHMMVSTGFSPCSIIFTVHSVRQFAVCFIGGHCIKAFFVAGVSGNFLRYNSLLGKCCSFAML
uniref:Uncharacterized protein n=1 Tax=Yersinia enterocolitica TaxID=630 RepID=B0RKY6_YEREN|nr:hypothetical protein [Yersinia enterocolitica]